MRIEVVTSSTFEKVLPLIAGYQRFYKMSPDDERNRRFFSQFLSDHSRGIQFVALGESDEALGFVTLYFHPSSLSARESCVLNDLFVLPDVRVRGVGKALVEYAIGYARERGFRQIDGMTQRENHTAQRLYDQYPADRSEWIYYSLSLE